MFKRSFFSILFSFVVTGLSATSIVRGDSLVLVTSAGAQGTTDTVKWSQLGPDNTVVPASLSVKSGKSIVYSATLAGPNSVTSVVCPAATCSWTGAGFTGGDTVLWTSDAGAGGNGPVTVKFGTGIAGAGALVQADAPGAFTAQIQAFNGSTLLGTLTALSNSHGDATYIGVKDQTGSNITSVAVSLTSCAGVCGDFAIGTLNLNQATAAPLATVSPVSLSFGNQLVGTSSAAKPVSLSNSGTAALSIASIVATGDYSQTNNCGTSLAAGASCTINVVFKPVATGTRAGTITITDNAASSPQSVTLTGVGISPAVTLNPASLTFVARLLNTSSPGRAVTLTNNGSAALTISSIVSSGDYSQTNTCGTSLAAGAACTITITFKPVAINTRTGTVKITDNAAGSPQTISLTGTGTEVKLSSTTVVFPVTKTGIISAPQTVTMTNVGTAAFGISSILVGGANPGDFIESNNCGASLGAAASCTVTLKFKPTVTGARKAAVVISDAGGASPQILAVSGTGQ